MSYSIHVGDRGEHDRGIHLDTEEQIAAYLNGVIESGNANQLTTALREIVRARRIGEIATTGRA
jgi:DNA-binding phage protein